MSSEPVGGILNQGVLEAVGRRGRIAAAEHQLGSDQPIQVSAELLLRAVGDRGQELVGELAPDHRTDLRDLLDRRQTVEARHQRVLKAARDRKRRQRAVELVAITLVFEQAGLEHRLR